MSKSTHIIYVPQKHLFFNDLATMIFSLYSYMVTRTVFWIFNVNGMPGQQRPADAVLLDIRRPVHDPLYSIFLDMNSSDDTFAVPLLWLQAPINMGGLLNYIEMYRVPKSTHDDDGTFEMPKAGFHFIRSMVGSAFVSYYSSQEAAIKAKFGSDVTKWPEVVNFGRVVRNGFAHGGTLDFSKGKSSATWKIWTYGPADHGKEFFYTPGGLNIGDVVLLFEEFDQALYPP